jgi:uncharacterized membrane protein
MFIAMFLVALGVIALAVWLVRTTGASRTQVPAGPAGETATQILDRRLAQGEITPEQYKERAAILGGR